MGLGKKLLSSLRRVLGGRAVPPAEPELIAAGWDRYAEAWQTNKPKVLPGHRLDHLGDEWTAEDDSAGDTTTYGLPREAVAAFDDYLERGLLAPHLPARAGQGLEIGPGGGRVTALLLKRTDVLHLAEPSPTMIKLLQKRFAGEGRLRYHNHTDGKTLPALPAGSLDYALAFDVFVHFEPRLVFWYLRQIAGLLKPGGTGVVHYSNVLTPVGWRQFEADLKANVDSPRYYSSFGVMCPQLMGKFLEALHLEIVAVDTGLIPRDAVAVFRKPGGGEKHAADRAAGGK